MVTLSFSQLENIFKRNRQALNEFKGIITPVIENAKDDHERLYWHHIYEEEDHRHDRLDHLLPALNSINENESPISPDSSEFVHLLQDISLEKFGLHNFLEHLDLSLYTFKDTELEEPIRSLRDMTAADYEETKQLLEQLNEDFKGTLQYNASVPTDEKEDIDENLKIDAYTSSKSEAPANKNINEFTKRKQLTVGSLKK
ncbi:IMEF encapsulin system ferritin-like cargo protein [Alteribacillus bidgolensis]|uniref:Encapsulated protein n=1 Tax=Alteribacillus bidgolensis TaxID=930129 RepID=A0A1G8L139_9BACI|nr:IMEF encapsulin system ferritin-like cargo protein [Alteribacillus bidgolensis]SDI49454.1 encapsulated protein [Alteribacillus bidgolensis]